MNLAGFEKIAPHLSSPLVPVGFVMLLAYGIHRQLMKSGLLRQVTGKDSSVIIRLFLRYGFWLALTLLVAGFGQGGWSRYMDREQPQIKELAPYQKAKEMQRKGLEPNEALASKKGMAAQYTHLGNTYMKHGELDKAEEMYRKGLAVYEALGSKEGMAADYGNLGFLYEKRGNLDNAEEMHRKSLRLFQEVGDSNAQRAQQALDALAQKRASQQAPSSDNSR